MSTSIMIFDRAFGKWNSLSFSEMFFLTLFKSTIWSKKENIKNLKKKKKENLFFEHDDAKTCIAWTKVGYKGFNLDYSHNK